MTMNPSTYGAILAFIFLTLSCLLVVGNIVDNPDVNGKRWAVLVAGSRGYENYRHQADVCHAYQVLKNGGLSDENIVVLMYDDIAFHTDNPRPGVIINKPNGDDVYEGVPKDYTGDAVNAENLYGVILGNKSAVSGGSGKVVDSGPNDSIFIFYADHGGAGILGMPTGNYVYAKDLIDVLKKKHAANTYKSMVIYVEACESGSIFEGLLPQNMNIYATTAANAGESSWGTYCPVSYPDFPAPEYDTCLGDLYSISWTEDCDKHDLRLETLKQQYNVVRRRTASNNFQYGSHVMQYGSIERSVDPVFSYMGTNPANDNYSFADKLYASSPSMSFKVVGQRDADLLHFWHRYHAAPLGSQYKLKAQKRLFDEISHRKHVEYSINQIGKLLFANSTNSSMVLESIRPMGQPVVDDWDCLKTIVRIYEKYCGSLSDYGMKYMRVFANMCNFGISLDQVLLASTQTCSALPPA